MPLRRIMGVRDSACARAVLRRPLVRACRTFGELPLETEQVLQVVVAPFCGCLGPRAFESAGDRVRAFAAAKLIAPSETLLFNIGAFRFGPYILRGHRSAMGLAEGVASGDQSYRLFI